MSNYQFSLTKVLNWRESVESVAKSDFLTQKNLQDEQEQKLLAIKKASNDLKVSSVRFSNINLMRQQYLYKNYLAEQIEVEEGHLASVTQETERELAIFLQAKKERKIMDKIKEKQYETFLFQQKNTEQKELDEMGSLRYGYSMI
ncbi:flagellar export protein FliJ [Vagococcus salmoninarum]|uniref:Flagellar FliJ protein n=1 Tax=Vagococcus salmoninarum TaxID=2739 RepID=A0A429ZT41_9ENTE|nr:flagellar FliJ family protein [Vagococcus salmoninarum]RST96809.1 hypothetical protein CBF35_04350 [Vagococcus salmoninarum]